MTDRAAASIRRGKGLVAYACVGRDHFAHGKERPDGSGHLTMIGGVWAYCAAGRGNEEHFWLRIDPRPLAEIGHAVDWLAAS